MSDVETIQTSNPLLLAKLVVALAIALVPMAPDGTFEVIWGRHGLLIQGAYILLLAAASYADIALGMLMAALVICIAVQRRYRSTSQNNNT